MRILLYNWVPSGSVITEGGGVALYLSNLATALADQGHEVFVLSSGFRYGLFSRKLTVAARKGQDKRIRYFDVLNSPVTAPSFYMFGDVPSVMECPDLVSAVRALMEQVGPLDVFHIQNIEGISFDVLSLAEVFPETKFILTNHNYHVVCQQANLWHQDKENCTTYLNGARCHTCNVFPADMNGLIVDRYMRWRRMDKWPAGMRALARRGLENAMRLRWGDRAPWRVYREPRWRGERKGPADFYRLRRQGALEAVNRHCASVLSVSHATEDILLSYGLDAARSQVRYIGTRHYDPARIRAAKAEVPHLRLAFLGYTRPDKGFKFLVDAIEAMPQELWGRFSLKVAARISDEGAVAALKALEPRLARLEVQDGYKQAELPALLKDVDLGLVLPLWNDALPQVAIEFVCHGVPILVSDRGGQQELAADPAFIFKAETSSDFWRRLAALQRDRSELERFWSLPRPLRTNAQHVEELLEIYRGEASAADAPAATVTEPPSRAPAMAEPGGLQASSP